MEPTEMLAHQPTMYQAILDSLRSWWSLHPLLNAAAVATAVYALLLCIPWAMDSRTILGLNPWIKPQKFAISLAIFLATMSWVLAAHRLHPHARTGVAIILILMTVLELALISIQSFRGVRSHFNTSTTLDANIYATMGTAIAIATLAVLAVACTPLQRDDAWPLTRPGPGVRAGLRWGEALFLLGCAWGAFMAPRTGHSVGGADGGPGLPYVNWSTRHGDTRVTHFILLHALQLMPLLGALIDRVPALAPRAPWILSALGLALLAIAAAVARRTMLGLPLLGP